MPQQLVDDTGLSYFVDDNGINLFFDDLSNWLGSLPITGRRKHIVFNV